MRVRLLKADPTKTRPTASRPGSTSARLGQPPAFLRGVAVTVLLSCLWSFGIAPVALAAQAGKTAPKRATVKRVVTPMTAAELSRRTALARKAMTQQLAKASKGRKKPGLPTLQEFLRRNQAAQQNATRRALIAAKHRGPDSPGSLLDEVGHLTAAVPPATVQGWKDELHAGNAGPRRLATLHLWLGEYLLAHDQHPQAADPHFLRAERLTSPKDPIYGLAAYDVADGLFYDGAYAEAADRFAALLDPKTASPGYDRANCALWLRHSRACAAYHAERANLGIPEPPRLDRYCGAAALAACLRALGLPSDRKTVLAACKVTGEGSSLKDIYDSQKKLGVVVRPLTATDEGLMSLPKPLVSFVENDHFIAVTGADKGGVSYLCSDCGAWPGGRVRLTWKQWHALSPGVYAAVTRPGSDWDRRLAAQGDGSAGPVRVATADLSARALFHVPSARPLRGVQMRDWTVTLYWFTCGYWNRFTLHCADCVQCCLFDGLGGGGGTGGGGGGKSGGPPHLAARSAGPGAGDPVNLATGEEEYTPPADLTVYNPHGPSVTWGRIYNSLRSTIESATSFADFGQGWSTSYNAYVVNGQTEQNTKLVLSNGASVPFTATGTPAVGQPVQCQVQPGAPMQIEWDSDASGASFYTVTWQDRTRWILRGSSSGRFMLSQIIDRDGNFITLNYSPASGLLQSITNQDGTRLLTLTRGASGYVSAVTDCYGRAIYYHVSAGDYGPLGHLDYVSQVVPACTANPPARYVLGYVGVSTPEASIPFLHTITVPSPTGTGTSTARIDYTPSGFVSRLTDGNGNTHAYTQVDGTHTRVDIAGGASGTVLYSYTGAYDNNLSGTGKTDGAGRTISTEIFSDPSDPYRPSAVLDGNASQSYPDPLVGPGKTVTLTATGSQSPSSATWDVVSPSGAVIATDATPSGWNVVIARLSSPTTLTITAPTGASVGSGYRARTHYYTAGFSAAFDVPSAAAGFGTTHLTWDSFGNLTSSTSPRGVTTTYAYDYSHFALGELTKVQEGTKTPTAYAYDEADGYRDANNLLVPCGLVTGIATPTPGSPSGSGAQVVTSLTYDVTGKGSQPMGGLGLGNVVSVTTPGNNATLVNGVDQGITTTFAYTGDGTGITSPSIGLPLSVTDNLGKITHLRYDAQGQTTATMDALGNETDMAYNESGGQVSLGNQVQSVTLPATGQTGSGHGGSAMGYLYPGGPALSTTTYDESGRAVRQVSTAYGPEGETLAVSGSTEPVSYTYDGLYRLSTLRDGGGHVTSYFYNTQGYLAQVVYPGAQATPPTAPLTAGTADTVTFTGYDADGNLLGRVDGRGITTIYAYADNESRLTGISYAYPNGYSGGTAGSVSLSYDGYGRRSLMSDGTGSQSYAYDDAGDLTQKTVTWTGLSPKTISYALYPNGTRSGMTADGQAFSYGYDKDGRMTGLVNPSSEASAWTYKDNGWLATRALNNSAGGLVVGTTYTRNPLGEVTDLLNQAGTGATLSEFGSMAYDGAGNRTTLTASVTSNTAYSGTTSYAYDYAQTASPALNRSQLTGETSTRSGNYTNVFGYDGGTGTGPGNPTTFKGAANTFNADNQIANAGYGYDGAGNPTTYQTKSLAFDPENRLTQYGPSATPAQTDGYDGNGLRTWKNSTGGLTYFLFDGTQPVCEYTVSRTQAAAALAAVNSFGADGLVSRHTSGGSTFYAFDERGNVAQRVSSSGNVQSSDLYDGYGARVSTGGADVWGFEAQAGYYTDGETGLILCTHRFYDPSSGRWLTRDPMGYNGGVNLYGYVRNDPTNWTDPTGLISWQGIVGIIGGILLGQAAGAVIAVQYFGPNPVALMGGILIGGPVGGAIGGAKGESMAPGCTRQSINDAAALGAVSGAVVDLAVIVIIVFVR